MQADSISTLRNESLFDPMPLSVHAERSSREPNEVVLAPAQYHLCGMLEGRARSNQLASPHGLTHFFEEVCAPQPVGCPCPVRWSASWGSRALETHPWHASGRPCIKQRWPGGISCGRAAAQAAVSPRGLRVGWRSLGELIALLGRARRRAGPVALACEGGRVRAGPLSGAWGGSSDRSWRLQAQQRQEEDPTSFLQLPPERPAVRCPSNHARGKDRLCRTSLPRCTP